MTATLQPPTPPPGFTWDAEAVARLETVVNTVQEAINTAERSRGRLLGQLLDPRRDIEAECGYPSLGGIIDPTFYQQLYEREAIAARVVEVLVRESWQVTPAVYEDENSETITAFEEAWNGLASTLRGTQSWFRGDAGSPVWEYLRRADELSGIGGYGVLLLGTDDGLPLDQPAAGFEEQGSLGREPGQPSPTPDQYGPYRFSVNATRTAGRKLTYLRVFPEALAQVTAYEANPTSVRYGHPTKYLLTLSDPAEQRGGIGVSTATVSVHWSRVLHIADNLKSSEVFGQPRLRPVLNNLLGLRKLYAGSPEMYWRGAFPGISLETNPQLGGNVRVDRSSIKDQMEDYMNGLQRYLLAVGMTARTLAPTVVDPSPQIDKQIEAVCIQLGVPVRVFKGSERGELASTQDDDAWNDRLKFRQDNYLTPRIILPFVDRLIQLGVLPQPVGYYVTWPDLTSRSDTEKADVAGKRTHALAEYVASGAESVMPPMDYLTRILGLTEDEAKAVLENAADALPPPDHAHPTDVPPLPVPGATVANRRLVKRFRHYPDPEGNLVTEMVEEQDGGTD